MNNIIITIGREYGSGGRYIGEKVSKKLNIPFYDKEILLKTGEDNNLNYSKLDEYDEVKRNKFFRQLEMLNFNNYSSSGIYTSDIYHTFISNTIKRIANDGSCVILGRNANNILRDRKNVINIFIYSNDIDFKVNRKMKLEGKNYKDTLNLLKNIDKKRRKYYEESNRNHNWGSIKDYDYLIDSSILGIDGTIDLIVDIYNKYKVKKETK